MAKPLNDLSTQPAALDVDRTGEGGCTDVLFDGDNPGKDAPHHVLRSEIAQEATRGFGLIASGSCYRTSRLSRYLLVTICKFLHRW